jgi:hypothetical protein
VITLPHNIFHHTNLTRAQQVELKQSRDQVTAARKKGMSVIIQDLSDIIQDPPPPRYSCPFSKCRVHIGGGRNQGTLSAIFIGCWNCNGAFWSSPSTLHDAVGSHDCFLTETHARPMQILPQIHGYHWALSYQHETRSDRVRGSNGVACLIQDSPGPDYYGGIKQAH